MASLRTPAAVYEGQSIIKVIKITSCVTGDTVNVPPSTKNVLVQSKTTTDVGYATVSGGVATITIANTPDIELWCLL